MRNRILAILMVALSMWPAFVPARAGEQGPVPARRQSGLPTAAELAGSTLGPVTNQLGLPPATFHCFMLVTAPNGKTITRIPGTATDPLYKGWSDLYGFGSSLARTVGPTGAPNSKISSPAPLTLTRAVDAATPTFFGLLTAGTACNFTFVVVRDTPDRIEAWKIRCLNALLSSQTFSVNEGVPMESDTIAYTALEWSYLNTDATGNVLNELYASFDVSRNTASQGTRKPTYPGGQDSNGNGILDGWEVFYGLDLNQPSQAYLDFDSDGQNNLQEFIAGTVPTDPNSVLRVSAVGRTSAGGKNTVTLIWNSVANKSYFVQSASSPGGPWTAVNQAPIPSAGDGSTSYQFDTTTSAPSFFYRVIVSQ